MTRRWRGSVGRWPRARWSWRAAPPTGPSSRAPRPARGASGEFDNRWLDRLTAAGEHVPAAQPVALLAAAVEAYAADHAAAQAAFHAGARRGRPEVPETVGTSGPAAVRGGAYDLRVYRTSPGLLPGALGDG